MLIERADRLRRHLASKIYPDPQGVISVEDVLQDVWLGAFRGIGAFRDRGPRAFDRWLFVIANRQLVDALRYARYRKRTAGRGGGLRRNRTSYVDLVARIVSPGKTPSREAASDEAADAAHIALCRLPDDRRRAIQMHYIEGRSHREIAQFMQKTPAAVNSLLFQGRREMRKYLGDAGKYFSDARSSDGARS